MRTLLILLVSSTLIVSAEFFSAQNAAFHYEGRIDLSDTTRATYDWPGITIQTEFSGSSVSLTFDDGGNWYNIEIDGVLLPILKAQVGMKEYLISDTLSSGTHSLKISKRFEQTWNQSSFLGITLNDGEHITNPNIKVDYKIEFIGASYVVGYGVESPDRVGDSAEYGTQDPYVYYTNSDLSYAHIVADTFQAAPMLTAISGKGVIRNAGNDSPTLPFTAYYDYTLLSPINTSATVVPWNFSSWQADLIVLNLGINDFSGDAVAPADTNAWVTAYGTFIDTIQERYNYPPIIVSATGDWPHNLARPSSQKVVAAQHDQGDSNVYYHDYTVAATALNWHPSVSEQQEMADGIIALIRDQNLLGNPSPITSTATVQSPKSLHVIQQGATLQLQGVVNADWKLYSSAGRMLKNGSGNSINLQGLGAGVYHITAGEFLHATVRVK